MPVIINVAERTDATMILGGKFKFIAGGEIHKGRIVEGLFDCATYPKYNMREAQFVRTADGDAIEIEGSIQGSV